VLDVIKWSELRQVDIYRDMTFFQQVIAGDGAPCFYGHGTKIKIYCCYMEIEQGKDIIYKLVAQADVVVDNFVHGDEKDLSMVMMI